MSYPSLPNVSNDVIWLGIRNNSTYIVKRPNYPPFSKEPTNLKNVHRHKYSGLANDKVIGVQASKDGKGISLITKTAGQESSPAKNYTRLDIKGTSRKVSKGIYNETLAKGYRFDLRHVALGRASAILKSQQQRPVKSS